MPTEKEYERLEGLAVVAATNEARHLENLRRFDRVEASVLALQRYVVVGLGASLVTLFSVIMHFFIAQG